jgi:transposase InsO family protein
MTIRSDRGMKFVNAIISQLLSLLQIEHELSLAYSKEHNAIVERPNKEVMRHLISTIFESYG